jgi:hypothetical protein
LAGCYLHGGDFLISFFLSSTHLTI